MAAFTSFDEIERYVLESGTVKRLVLAGAHDSDALAAAPEAEGRGIVEPILIGDAASVRAQLETAGRDPRSYRIVDEPDGKAAIGLAVGMVRSGEADIPMKGLMHTSVFMHGILDKEHGLRREGQLLSQASLVEVPEWGRLIVVSDVAVNIDPDVETKVKIVRNALELAGSVGMEDPKVALLSALEVENPAIPSTVDAAKVVELMQDECTIQGPLALDNAVSEEAARHKGIEGPVAGHADVLIVPDLWSGNIFSKSLVFFAHLRMSGTLNGLSSPVVMTSRSETAENKYLSILTAVLQSMRQDG